MDEAKLVATLDRKISGCRKTVRRYDQYFEGEQPLRYMAPELEAEIGDRVTQLVINWPRLVAEAYDERLDIEGFRYAGVESGNDDLWAMWQANDGDEQSQQAHLEALIHGRAYVIAGAGDDDDDPPVMTVEHPSQCAVVLDPRTRKVMAGLKRWSDEDRVQWAVLYLPDSNVTLRKSGRWVEDARDDHELGEPLMTMLVNRGRMLRPEGRSEFHDVIPVADAANKMATDMMISGEFHAMPRRWAVGLTEADFIDKDTGEPLSVWSAIAGRIWSSEKKPDDVKYGQFDESDLAVFHNTIKLLAQVVTHLAALPQDYMSFTSDNPTSADAIRAAESRMVKRTERKQGGFSGGWEAHMRKMIRIMSGGELPPEARRLETVWRDAATPTVAQKADAVMKLVTTRGADGRGIVPIDQARKDLGYSPAQIKEMAEMDRQSALIDPVASLAAQFREPANAGS